MVDFPSNAPTASYGSRPSKDYRFISANFGDGYSQRSGDGLNTVIEKWDMVWNTITTAEKDILVDFFDAREGYEAFNFTPPGEDTAKKFIVSGVKPEPINATYWNVSAVFTRVYDL